MGMPVVIPAAVDSRPPIAKGQRRNEYAHVPELVYT
jgi:hypothetical protein